MRLLKLYEALAEARFLVYGLRAGMRGEPLLAWASLQVECVRRRVRGHDYWRGMDA